MAWRGMPSAFVCFMFMLTVLGVALIMAGLKDAAARQAQESPKPPDDSRLWVWPPPDKGAQSMLVLKVLDNDALEVAYLVPAVVVLDYRGGERATREQLEASAVGKLLPFDLRGRDRFGRLTGDAWLGKQDGWLTAFAKVQKPQDKKPEKPPEKSAEKPPGVAK